MAQARSGFLNILTILSFVGIAIFVGVGIYQIVLGTEYHQEIFATDELYKQAQDEIVQAYQSDPIMLEAQLAILDAKRHVRSGGIMTLLLQVFCLLGVLKMRKGNKVGFALYTIGELGVPIASMVLMGVLAGIVGLFIGLIFVFLYGTRLNEMRLHKVAMA